MKFPKAGKREEEDCDLRRTEDWSFDDAVAVPPTSKNPPTESAPSEDVEQKKKIEKCYVKIKVKSFMKFATNDKISDPHKKRSCMLKHLIFRKHFIKMRPRQTFLTYISTLKICVQM